MTRRKYQKPLAIDLSFDEALARFAQVDPKEVGELVTRQGRSDLVPLAEDDSGHRFLVYSTDRGVSVDLRYEGATFWASQAQMAEMFGVTQQAVSEHIL